MSSSAHGSLTTVQKEELSIFGEIVHADLTTIETCGGGSGRCLIAEIHLAKRDANLGVPTSLSGDSSDTVTLLTNGP